MLISSTTTFPKTTMTTALTILTINFATAFREYDFRTAGIRLDDLLKFLYDAFAKNPYTIVCFQEFRSLADAHGKFGKVGQATPDPVQVVSDAFRFTHKCVYKNYNEFQSFVCAFLIPNYIKISKEFVKILDPETENERERRNVIGITFSVPSMVDITVLTTHLSINPDIRAFQTQCLTKYCQTFNNTLIVCGDFNWFAFTDSKVSDYNTANATMPHHAEFRKLFQVSVAETLQKTKQIPGSFVGFPGDQFAETSITSCQHLSYLQDIFCKFNSYTKVNVFLRLPHRTMDFDSFSIEKRNELFTDHIPLGVTIFH